MSETPTGADPGAEPGTEPAAEPTPESTRAPAPEPELAGPEPSTLTVGGVLGAAFSLYTRFFSRFFVLALVVFLALNLITAIAAAALRNGSGGAALVSVIAMAASIVGTYWLGGALVLAVQDVRDGRADSSIGELLGKVTPFLGTLVGAGILAGIGIAVGLLLLIAPGVYLLTIWALIAPVIVLEQKGVLDAFGRSRELVSGRFWTVLGIVLVAGILAAVANGIVTAVLSFLPLFLQYWIGGAIASAVAVPFLALAITLTYFTLRREKEGAADAAA